MTVDSARALWTHEAPARSPVGFAILALSVVVMPVLAHAKKRVALGMGSGALAAEATQTSLCAWLSAIALAGVALNAALGWWCSPAGEPRLRPHDPYSPGRAIAASGGTTLGCSAGDPTPASDRTERQPVPELDLDPTCGA